MHVDGIDTDYALDAATAASPAVAPASGEDVKKKRTAGMRIFDTMLYPILSNTGVFTLSVFFTYLTEHGNETHNVKEIKEGVESTVEKLKFGKFGKWMAGRGTWLDAKFEKVGMSPDGAKMSRFVFFSFADGTLLAPLVKLFEDRRNGISKRIDSWLGSKPQDESVYDQEPKQSWGSVIGGRAITAAIVVPTALALQKSNPFAIKYYENIDKETQAVIKTPFLNTEGNYVFKSNNIIARGMRKLTNTLFYKDNPIQDASTAFDKVFIPKSTPNEADMLLRDANINDILFNRGGAGYGKKIESIIENKENVEGLKKGRLTHIVADATDMVDAAISTKLNKPSLFKIVAFEAFYTSLCTAGLYITSRFIARTSEKRKDKKAEEAAAVEQWQYPIRSALVNSIAQDVPTTTVSEVSAKDGWAAQKSDKKEEHNAEYAKRTPQEIAQSTPAASHLDKEKMRAENPAVAAQL
jgi:hypothetical protein